MKESVWEKKVSLIVFVLTILLMANLSLKAKAQPGVSSSGAETVSNSQIQGLQTAVNNNGQIQGLDKELQQLTDALNNLVQELE